LSYDPWHLVVETPRQGLSLANCPLDEPFR